MTDSRDQFRAENIVNLSDLEVRIMSDSNQVLRLHIFKGSTELSRYFAGYVDEAKKTIDMSGRYTNNTIQHVIEDLRNLVALKNAFTVWDKSGLLRDLNGLKSDSSEFYEKLKDYELLAKVQIAEDMEKRGKLASSQYMH